MPNLIVIIFNLLYPVFIMGFDCKGCMLERENVCEDSSNWSQKSSCGYLVTKLPVKWSTCLAHDWNAKSQYRMETAVSREYLIGKAFPIDTHKTFSSASLYYLIHTFCTHTIYTHKCWGVLLRENPSQTPWELEIIIPIYLYTYACGFPKLLPLHFHNIERLIAQTLTTPFLSVKWAFGVARKHWKKPRMADATWSLLRDPELDKTRFREALLE